MSNLGDVLRQVVCTPKHIPGDWQFYKLTDICNPKQWKTISASEMTESGYPVFGANGFVGFYHEYNHEHEAIAITCRGNTCGTINRIPPKTYITGNSMALDDIKRNVITQDFLYYALKYRGVGDSISGSAQPQITGSGLRSIEFPAPPLPEQQKIATILSSVDDVIEKTRAQIDKLKDLKTGMMQELLTKGIGHTEFKDSPVGRIPAEWEVVTLEQICDPNAPITYGVLKPGNYVDGGRPLLQIKDLGEGTILAGGLHLIGDDLDYEYRRSRVQFGDIVISLVGTIGRTAMIPCWLNQPNIHRNLGRIRTRHNQYVFQFLQSESAKLQLGLTSAGSSQSALNLSALRQMSLPLPSPDEAQEITKILSSVDERIKVTTSRLNQLNNVKRALMQDLLTGKVRVKPNKSAAL